MQGAVAAAELDGRVDAAAGPLPHDRPGPTLGVGRDGLDAPIVAGHLEPAGQHVDGDHVGAGERGQTGGEQADDALTEHREPVAQPGRRPRARR